MQGSLRSPGRQFTVALENVFPGHGEHDPDSTLTLE